MQAEHALTHAPTSAPTPTHLSTKRAYVLKMYPRFSETFIVSEILAREAAGEELIIFSLRPSTDTRFHPELARVKAPVIHVERPSSARSFWQTWQESMQDPRIAAGLKAHLGDITELSHDDAVQAAAVARLALEHEVTHLHAHFASVATTVARAASALTGIAYSFTTHAKDIFHESVELDDLSAKVADADHVIAISDYNHSYLRRTLGPELSERIVVVRNGLELDRFPYRPDIDERPIGSAQSIPSLLAVGRLVEKKGFAHLLTALARLRDAGLPCHLDLVGTGPLEDELRELILTLHLTELVDMHGALTQSEVREMFVSHDLLVAPFVIGADGNADGLPTVLLEGMATGIPCIAGTVTAVPEVIINDETGWLVEGDDPDQIASTIAEAVHRLQENPASVREITDAARRLVCREHDSRSQARELADLVTGAVATETPAADVLGQAESNTGHPASNTDRAASNTDRELEHVS
ncbi:glycosyltransferase family 4 protein [Brevibacterium antiquum]|uniref:glycosyltransferase family 4 protein n=1 Tax=Brevibacterium antiquum TaxID=234835 RepID=UPI0018DF23A1|nr:glycosyltransferase family 4 protein [Brevibacterium antiquum]